MFPYMSCMFLRQTARYNEVLESYIHPRSRKSTHRTIARWSRERSLAEEMAQQIAGYEAAMAVRTHFSRSRPRTMDEVVAFTTAIDLMPRIWAKVEKLIAARNGLAASAARRRPPRCSGPR
jgi:hypothetical protein